jgi:chorismate-pyruvate lyase
VSDASNNPSDASNNPSDASNNPSDAISVDSLAVLECSTWFPPWLWRSLCGGPISGTRVTHWLPKLTPFARLTATQRMLLATDGSVTILLEALTGRAIRVRVLSQAILPASPALAAEVGGDPGTALIHRVAAMCDESRVMCIGSSVLLAERLPAGVVRRLETTEISLGKLIFQPRVGVQRQPVSVDVMAPTEYLAQSLVDQRFLVRHSRLAIGRDTVGSLREWFPEGASRSR